MKPVELFRFVMGSDVWTFTSADRPVVYNGEAYLPVPMGRSGMEAKNELSKANLEIQLDLYNPLARLLLRSTVEEVLTLTMFAHTEAATGTAWKGRLASLKPGVAQLTLSFESIFTSMRRPGLRARYQRTCRYALYGRGCRLKMENFALDGTATAVSGDTVTVAAATERPNGWWVGGMIRGPDNVLRWILGHAGNQLTLSRPLESIGKAIAATGAAAVKLYPGCDHNRETCQTKFNNLPNFGGFPWIPSKNPMVGSIL